MSSLLFEAETYSLIYACIKVHKTLGNGFTEEVYHEALEKELAKAAIPFEHHKKLPVYYEGKKLDSFIMSDFVCYQKIMVEVETVNNIHSALKRRVINYLRSTDLPISLLVNFNEKSLT